MADPTNIPTNEAAPIGGRQHAWKTPTTNPVLGRYCRICGAYESTVGTDAPCLAARHDIPQIDRLMKARRAACVAADGTGIAASRGWAKLEEIGRQLAAVDPAGDWYYEGNAYDGRGWVVNRPAPAAAGRFVVIENTPGYLPEDDEPARFDSYEAACAYLREEAHRALEEAEEAAASDGWQLPARPVLSIDRDAAGLSYAARLTDEAAPRDLGRVWSVETTEPDPGPVDPEADAAYEAHIADVTANGRMATVAADGTVLSVYGPDAEVPEPEPGQRTARVYWRGDRGWQLDAAAVATPAGARLTAARAAVEEANLRLGQAEAEARLAAARFQAALLNYEATYGPWSDDA